MKDDESKLAEIAGILDSGYATNEAKIVATQLFTLDLLCEIRDLLIKIKYGIVDVETEVRKTRKKVVG